MLSPSSPAQGLKAPEASADSGAKITQPGDYTFKIEHGGLWRMYRVHVPAKLDPAVPAPLLVSLHGGGASMDYQANDAHYGQVSKSEREGFVVVFPNGFSKLRSGKLATWNAGNCCGGARDENVDDVGFIRQVVANLTRQMNIDRKRIYATGMSNGGLMAYRLACEASDVFTAIAPVAGTDNTRSCAPKNPVSVLHIHARNDSHVLFTGGAGANSMARSLVTEFTSVPDTVAKWVRLNGCSATTPRRVLDKAGACCEVYAPCQGNTQVQLCDTEKGGHSWPGSDKTRGEPASQAINANDVMWEFFDRR
jgi:polyhydroxybutyrate depolymerase